MRSLKVELRESATFKRGVSMASSENILSWNFANWITVVLMAAIAFAILGIIQKYMQGQVSTPAGGS